MLEHESGLPLDFLERFFRKNGKKTVPTPLRRKILLIFKKLAKMLKSVNQGRVNIAHPNLQMQIIMLKIINEASL